MDSIKVQIKGDSLLVRLATAFAQQCSSNIHVDAHANRTEVEWQNTSLTRTATIARLMAHVASMYGTSPFETAQVDHWIDFSQQHLNAKITKTSLNDALICLEEQLKRRNWFLDNTSKPSMADVAIFAAIRENQLKIDTAQFPSVVRWVSVFQAIPVVENTLKALPAKPSKTAPKEKGKDQGKFFDLEGASEGNVVTRFPPEASGYLHIGHAKAAMLNYVSKLPLAIMFTFGKLIMRFDDTNPAKENAEFEKVILEDLELLNVKYDIFSHTSDHFDRMSDMMEKMIQEGKAFVDMTSAEELKEQRLACKPSPYRDQSVDENLRLWEEMKKGSEIGVKCFVRAKIDYKNTNGALRDPTLYRCKNEPHIRTGTKYKVYPTYDFACPIVDSIEGVTHALRTTEYHDRDEQYAWICKALNIREPKIMDFSRLNMVYTVMSKRQLTKFVEAGLVDGWSDPRFPTVRGILRRGMTVEGLSSFILAMGSSRTSSQMEWDKIWATNKKVIDPVAPRYTALDSQNIVHVTVKNFSGKDVRSVPLHPKNPDVGTKEVVLANQIVIEQEDAQVINVKDKITLMDWGNAIVDRVEKNGLLVTAMTVTINEQDKDFSNTLKLTWLPADEIEQSIPVTAFEYLPLITIPFIPKGEPIEPYLRDKSKYEIALMGTTALANLKQGDIIQLNRKGFFVCDQEHHPLLQRPVHLIYIPDGHAKTFIAHKDATAQIAATAEEKADVELQLKLQKAKIVEMKKKKAEKADIRTAESTLKKLQDQLDSMHVATLNSSETTLKLTSQSTKANQETSLPLSTPAPDGSSAAAILQEIYAQGDRVRQLKKETKDKSAIKPEIDKLLALKAQYEKLTGHPTPPPGGESNKSKASTKKENPTESEEKLATHLRKDEKLNVVHKERPVSGSRIDSSNGKEVRQLKEGGQDFKSALEILLKLKADYVNLTGEAPPSGGRGSSKSKKSESKKKAFTSEQSTETEIAKSKPHADKPKISKSSVSSSGKQQTKPSGKGKAESATSIKGQTRLGIEAKKTENFPEWYSQVITKAKLIEYYDVSGCYVLLPHAYFVWEQIQGFFNLRIQALGVSNCYFPMFVTMDRLQKEKDHIDDFAPEVAWVTRAGDSDLEQPIAIRPTSETIMYPAYAKHVQSYRDLPIKLNQWSNVVRWEFKQPTPFLRSREFLWQEGHTAFATQEEAEKEVYQILDLYRQIYEDLLAVPMIPGTKTEKEKFAGGVFTTTVEGFIPATGRGIQGATSHHLGQNFSKMFEISFQDPKNPEQECFAYQNSWGITTRTIGVMIMVHSDDKGLVLPPRVARLQVVVIPTGLSSKLSDTDRDTLLKKAQEVADVLAGHNIRSYADVDLHVSPPWKYNHYELQGIPVRIEIGPRDLQSNSAVAVLRDTGAKETVSLDGISKTIQATLDNMHGRLFTKAKEERDAHIKETETWEEVTPSLNEKNLLVMPFCGDKKCEEDIKRDSESKNPHDPTAPAMGAKSLCVPFMQPKKKCSKCIYPSCTIRPVKWTLFGRSY
eukprot:gene2777-5630_t